jgi:hypothetical protein
MHRTRVKVFFSSAFVLACVLALTVIATAVVAPAPPQSTTPTAPAFGPADAECTGDGPLHLTILDPRQSM